LDTLKNMPKQTPVLSLSNESIGETQFIEKKSSINYSILLISIGTVIFGIAYKLFVSNNK